LPVKFKPAKWRALVSSLKPMYTASAPQSIAVFRAGKLPAGHRSSIALTKTVSSKFAEHFMKNYEWQI
jgi:hypothetical protein